MLFEFLPDAGIDILCFLLCSSFVAPSFILTNDSLFSYLSLDQMLNLDSCLFVGLMPFFANKYIVLDMYKQLKCYGRRLFGFKVFIILNLKKIYFLIHLIPLL